MEPDFAAFINYWGQSFVRELKRRLALQYLSAPGINEAGTEEGDAYAEGRNPGPVKYGPELRVKSAMGSKLYESIEGRMTPDGFELLMLDYWEYVNYGRRRGNFVPIRPLEEWARTKGFPNPTAAAWGANYNIKKFGIAPTFFYDNAITSLEAQFDMEADEMMERTLNDFFDKLIETNTSIQ